MSTSRPPTRPAAASSSPCATGSSATTCPATSRTSASRWRPTPSTSWSAFSNFLDREAKNITGRIETINGALADIDYRPGTYIRLEAEHTVDPVVREFRGQLRDITSNALLGDDDTYAEARFLNVKDLLDRFAGRDGSTSADQTWTNRVTDVRNWYSFAASERARETRRAVEHYADSGGKSGGQKEKLAYTILAASLSYQYGLAGGHHDAFRFVMIDEAFGRGSDESTRFGLELFTRLGLQLLVVTPLQKIAHHRTVCRRGRLRPQRRPAQPAGLDDDQRVPRPARPAPRQPGRRGPAPGRGRPARARRRRPRGARRRRTGRRRTASVPPSAEAAGERARHELVGTVNDR